MKLSLSWIFDHINGSWKDIDPQRLFETITTKVVEVEDARYLSLQLSDFTLGRVQSHNDEVCKLISKELQATISLPARSDVRDGEVYLLRKHADTWRWADSTDLGGQKDGILPALLVSDADFAGAWKDAYENEDYILTIDNVAITHRPDLWGHRGFAREIAGLLEMKLRPLSELAPQIPTNTYEYEAAITPESDFGITIQDKEGCRRLAGLYIPQVDHAPSLLFMASRLARVDSRPIDAVVDTTNYVMFDLSQPLHAFDAQKITPKRLVARRAQAGEKLTLLDEQEIELTKNNLIIADENKPVALAGIMGGLDSSVTKETSSLLVESASFDPLVIRSSTQQFKVRTDASSRFEKNLDPNQNVDGLMRFAGLLKDSGLISELPNILVSVGKEASPHEIIVEHRFIEEKLGLVLHSDSITTMLEGIGFGVEEIAHDPLTYKVTVPTFRGTKDVRIKEDIAEEVGRLFGLDAIPHQLPLLALKPHSLNKIVYAQRVRNYLAFGAGMHEVRNYALFDEHFLRELHWKPRSALEVVNPVSEFMYQLVTSLVPNMLKNLTVNPQEEQSFFECNAIWHKRDGQSVEQQSLAGLFYAAKQPVDFYEKKAVLHELFKALELEVSWVKADKGDLADWYHPYKTAALYIDEQCIGYAGMSNPAFTQSVLTGEAFIFECDLDQLLAADRPIKNYKPASKYQGSWADISMMIPTSLTAAEAMRVIRIADSLIQSVELVDHFQKEDWKDERSLTIRYYAQSDEATLKGEQIEAVHKRVEDALKKMGATIR